MKEIWSDVESIVIQGAVGMKEESFNLSNLPALIALEIGCGAFKNCHSIVFENLNQLQSITLEYGALCGDGCTTKSNELIMKNLPSLSSFKGDDHNLLWIGIVILENIPSLTEDHIWMNASVFSKVRELHSSNADSFKQFILQRNVTLQWK